MDRERKKIYRIGIDASRANRKHKSGTEWYAYHLIREIAKLDKENEYLLYSDKELTADLTDLTGAKAGEVKFDDQGYQLIKSPYNNFKAKILNWPFNFFWTQGRLSLEMIFRRPDVLFIPSHTLPFVHPKKSVVTIHDIGFAREDRLYDHEEMGPASRPQRKVLNFLVRIFTLGKFGANLMDYYYWSTCFGLKHSKKIITVSNFSKNEICDVCARPAGLSLPQLKERIKVIYNGYDRLLYREIGDEEKTKEILKKYGVERPFILYVGRLDKKKNIPNLISSFALFKQKNKELKHKLVLVGAASFGYSEINYRIEGFNLDQEVIVPGWVEENDLPYLYAAADAFVFPSFYEGFGIPLLQAMAAGIPIIASRATSIPEVAGEAALLFDPLNNKEMAEAMEKIITDRALREKLISRGNERIKNFSWEKCARETLEEIKKL